MAANGADEGLERGAAAVPAGAHPHSFILQLACEGPHACVAQVEGQDEEQLRFLLAHDRDPFCRWEAGQRLLRSLLLALYAAAADESKARAWPPKQAQLLVCPSKLTYVSTTQSVYHSFVS